MKFTRDFKNRHGLLTDAPCSPFSPLVPESPGGPCWQTQTRLYLSMLVQELYLRFF